eukprot:GFUD01137871.1.p1 GENE.GFUD01137871.1~~GFUD01137871.1.p1  ORF type:complete len:824 (-),score=300.44 GFUD01137871.1:355-2826(-)
MAPSSKGKVASDHVKAFNVAVTEYKSKACEKALAEIDKILAVLAKISDSSIFSPSQPDAFSLLLNCQYLLSYLDHKANTVWGVVGLLTTLCSQDPAVTKLLRTRLELLPICAKLLHSLPSTTQARTLKLLQLLKLVVDGVIITRREAYLTSLLADLSSFLSDSTPDLSSLSLFILCCLCRGNYISTKLLLSTLPPPTITALFSTPNTTPSDQLISEMLCYFMTRVQLSSHPPSPAKVNSYLPKLMDVFCSSYVADDISLMSLLISFLSSLSTDTEYRSILAQQDCLPSLQQLLVVADFSDEFSLSTSSHLFTFLTTLITTYHTDNVQLFDVVLKVVLARLDAKPYNKVASALVLVKTLVQNMDFSSMSDAVARNLKFQLDQLLPSLLATFLDRRSSTKLSSRSKTDQVFTELDREAMASCLECLQLLQVVASVPLKGWGQAVGETVKANKMVMAYRGYTDILKELVDRARLTTEFFTLAIMLGEVDNSWGKVVVELLGDKDRIQLVAEILRQENMEGSFMKKALTILNKTDSPETMFGVEKEDEAVGGDVEDQAVIPEQLARIDSLMEGVTEALGKMEVEQVVGEVMQLATVRRGQEKQQLAYMMEALGAADARVAAQNTALVEREEQVRALERVVMELVVRLGANKEELGDIRAQHGDLSREADCTRDKLGKELGEARSQLEELQTEKVVLVEKYGRYKDQVVRLTEDLKQYKDNQEQLEVKLKQEMRGREELVVTVSKREERLKKKEKQLDEEMSARERAEKENDDLRKQCASLETLSKRQEQALSKKEKLLQESQEETKEMRRVQDAIFNLSKARGSAAC